MRPISSPEILDLWEKGTPLHPLDRNLLVLRAATPDLLKDNPADWPLGRVNRALVDLFSQLFGPNLEGWLSCAECAEKLEFQMEARAIAGHDNGTPPSISANGRVFRLPSSRDLARTFHESDTELAALRLLECCHLEGEPPILEDIEAVGEQMASADPLAEIRLTLNCPTCKHEWDETLDLGTFIWAKIEARARKLLREIHTLAAVYGWNETEILSLSDSRRSVYLQMVEA